MINNIEFKEIVDLAKYNGNGCYSFKEYLFRLIPYGEPKYYKGKYKDFVDFNEKKEELIYNFHITTIAFDCFRPKDSSKNKKLKLPMHGIYKASEISSLKLDNNRFCSCNIYMGTMIGKNHNGIKGAIRSEKLKKYSSHNFVITIKSQELKMWLDDFDFFRFEKGKIIEDVLYIDSLSFQSKTNSYENNIHNHSIKLVSKNNSVWSWYYNENFNDLNEETSGKWMYFFDEENTDFISEKCKDSITKGIVTRVKHSNANKGVACFYLNIDDIKTHKQILQFFLDNNMIRKTKDGLLYDISFKLDSQTRRCEYSNEFSAILKLSDLIDLNTGEFII